MKWADWVILASANDRFIEKQEKDRAENRRQNRRR
jgi:hypothetical protein